MQGMAKVLRGGKWGNVPPRSASRSAQRSSSQQNGTGEANPTDEERKEIGVASYEVSTNEIHISRVSARDDYANATRIVSSLERCHLVLPASYKDNVRLLQSLDTAKHVKDVTSKARNSSADTAGPDPRESGPPEEAVENITVLFLPNQEFGVSKATERCALITVLGMPRDLEPEARMAFLSHILGDDAIFIRSVGGLMSFILQNGVLGCIGDDEDSVHISAIRHRNYCDVMQISTTTLRALNVFSQDTHPVGRGGMRGKEGLSLYGIIKGHVKTASARNLLRSWLHYPLTDLNEIEQRQFLVQRLREASNRAFLVALRDGLKGVRNVPGVLGRLKRVSAGVNDWKALYSSAKSYVTVSETLKVALQQDQRLLQSPLIARAMTITENHLRETVNWLDAVADFDESTFQGRMVVAPGFSEEIDERKRSYAAMDDFLTRAGIQELNSLLDKENSLRVETLNMTYEPQIGFLITLSEEECERIGLESLENHGLSFVFRTARESFFKNERCRELDEEPGDIHGEIADLEGKAFRYLEDKIFQFAPELQNMSAIVTELDCLQALASSANEYSWAMPQIFDQQDAELEIEAGRHPLLELAVPTYIPNSTRMKCGDVHVITGPNYSGKSAYLAQVALITILAQIGSCVPAKRAKLALITGINSRISSFESVTHGQSSFFADASHVAPMLATPQGRFLNLIDEFGKGTAESDGMALLTSVLRSILRKPLAGAPLTVCATHFVEILKEPFLPLSNPRLGLFSMEVMARSATVPGNPERTSSQRMKKETGARSSTLSGDVLAQNLGQDTSRHSGQDTANTNKETGRDTSGLSAVVRTYRLLAGAVCEESRALQCAMEAGVPKSILQRAAHIHDAVSRGTKIQNSVASQSNNRRIRACAHAVRAFITEPDA